MPITDKAMWINERHISTRGTGSAEVHCKQNKNRIQNKIDCKCSETRSKHTQKLKKDADFKILQPFQHHKLKQDQQAFISHLLSFTCTLEKMGLPGECAHLFHAEVDCVCCCCCCPPRYRTQ